MTAVFKHELRMYFRSLTAYVFGAFCWHLPELALCFITFRRRSAILNLFLSFCSLVFVVIVPILTMRVIAEERKQRTDQLLYSLPVTTTQVIIGKYLALLVIYAIPLAIISIYPMIFAQFGDVYLLTSYGSILAFFVMGAALIAVGVFISSLTDNQGLAAGIRNCCDPVKLLQCQPVGICFRHSTWICHCPGCTGADPGIHCEPFNKK